MTSEVRCFCFSKSESPELCQGQRGSRGLSGRGLLLQPHPAGEDGFKGPAFGVGLKEEVGLLPFRDGEGGKERA